MGFQTNSHLENEERKDSSQIQTDIGTILYTVYILDCLQSQPLMTVYSPTHLVSHQEAYSIFLPLGIWASLLSGPRQLPFLFSWSPGQTGKDIRSGFPEGEIAQKETY